MKRFLRGFKFAWRGIVYCVAHERNFRFHIVAAAFVAYFASSFYQLSRAEWAVLALTCALVLSLEAVNTALERLCDKVSAEQDDKIRIAKDCAAGAVLIAAIFAVGVAFALFFDVGRLAAVGMYFWYQPWRAGLLILAGVFAAAFVFLPERRRKK